MSLVKKIMSLVGKSRSHVRILTSGIRRKIPTFWVAFGKVATTFPALQDSQVNEASCKSDSNFHRRARAHHHQHGAALAYGFVTKVYAYHGICTHCCGAFWEFTKRFFLCAEQHFFIRTRASANKVAHWSKDVAEYVGAKDSFGCNDAQVLLYGASFDCGSGCE